MTNAQIIFNERINLLNAGKIAATGRILEVVDNSGKKSQIPEPEEIHTYSAWRQLGFQVKRGQKAVSKFPIWKHVVKAKPEGEKGTTEGEPSEPEAARMFLKVSAFFSRSQVEGIKL